jgi:hypothetical protein
MFFAGRAKKNANILPRTKMIRIILSVFIVLSLGACDDNGQVYYLRHVTLEKNYIACADHDLIKLIASNYGSNSRRFEQVVKIGLDSGNCRIFRQGDGVMVSVNKFSGRIETINELTLRKHYAAFDPVD